MPVQHKTPERQTRSQARTQGALPPTSREPLNGTLAVPQLREHWERGTIMKGEAPSRREGRPPRRSTHF
ncbi:hypothetical protein O181_066088 [Austropuccinia psidii MF-1]|uniref:Uncharacterized protein n=1 Tax=Austropuccinia psidii MF-1 TaxID=1389203 RepID=A0A9Q3I389_9BASI|nr:hypothetical protein [Austropuccinia psidii MF-1]